MAKTAKRPTNWHQAGENWYQDAVVRILRGASEQAVQFLRDHHGKVLLAGIDRAEFQFQEWENWHSRLTEAMDGGDPWEVAWLGMKMGRLAEIMRLWDAEDAHHRERKRTSRKKVIDEKRADIAGQKKARALQMFREWYLHVPKRERPNKTSVEEDIARRLNKEFPSCPTKPRTVRSYLVPTNSENV